MKKLLLFLITFTLIGCSPLNLGETFSSLELEDARSSEDEAQRILSLGLTHEESLKEASKLTPHLASVVSLKLTNARDKKIQYDSDLLESKKLTELVVITNNGLTITGPVDSEVIETSILETDFNSQSYFLQGFKDANTGKVSHKLYITVVHNSKNKREYSSAIFCDSWGRCEDNEQDLITLSTNASNCSSNSCDYDQVMELALTNELLNEKMNDGFTLRLISKKKKHKIKISAPYLMSYLSIAK